MVSKVVATKVTPKGYSRILDSNIRRESNPIGLGLWRQAASALALGNTQAASDLMQRAKANSSLYAPHPAGGYWVL